MKLSRFPNIKVEIIRKTMSEQAEQIIFLLRKRNGSYVYMKQFIYKEKGGIVLADKTKFLALWQNMQYKQEPHLSYGDESVWKQDYKYHFAEKGFKIGKDNPVPLAIVNYGEYIRYEPIIKKYLLFLNRITGYKKVLERECSFTDGITRTIWLWANGIEEFPILAYSEYEVKMLARYIGVTENAYYTFSELQQELNF